MAKTSEAKKMEGRRRILVAGAFCALGLVLGLATGCQSPSQSVASHDPLFGEKVPDKPFGVTGPPPPPMNRAGMAPSPPQATASKSAAAMLIPDPLTGGKQLAITDPVTTTQPTSGWQAKDPQPGGLTGNGGAPGVILKTPESTSLQPVPPPIMPSSIPGQTSGLKPVPPPVMANALPGQASTLEHVPPPVMSGVIPGPVTGLQPVPTVNLAGFSQTDDLKNSLAARGVIWQDQQQFDGGVRFRCRVANPQNPNSVRVYEATAADYPTAVQAVLNQIDTGR
jgi:hypothetical protein